MVALVVKNPPANSGGAGNIVLSLDWEDPLEEEILPTPGFLPGEPRGRGAWWATVHRVAKSQKQLKRLSPHTDPVMVRICVCWL